MCKQTLYTNIKRQTGRNVITTQHTMPMLSTNVNINRCARNQSRFDWLLMLLLWERARERESKWPAYRESGSFLEQTNIHFSKLQARLRFSTVKSTQLKPYRSGCLFGPVISVYRRLDKKTLLIHFPWPDIYSVELKKIRNNARNQLYIGQRCRRSCCAQGEHLSIRAQPYR